MFDDFMVEVSWRSATQAKLRNSNVSIFFFVSRYCFLRLARLLYFFIKMSAFLWDEL